MDQGCALLSSLETPASAAPVAETTRMSQLHLHRPRKKEPWAYIKRNLGPTYSIWILGALRFKFKRFSVSGLGVGVLDFKRLDGLGLGIEELGFRASLYLGFPSAKNGTSEWVGLCYHPKDPRTQIMGV